MNIAIFPPRGGSKRIPENIKTFLRKPIIAYNRKHFTLSRHDKGPNSEFSLESKGLKNYAKTLRKHGDIWVLLNMKLKN